MTARTTHPDKHLLVLLAGHHIGDVTQDRHGRLAFTYQNTWRTDPAATPLSLSMPLTQVVVREVAPYRRRDGTWVSGHTRRSIEP